MPNLPSLYIYQAVSILSVTGSAMVILSSVVFKDMRSKIFMHIIANISLADIIANIEYTMTYRPSNDNWWCSLQGFLNLYGYPCSWLWTTMLMQFLHDLAVHKRIRLSMPAAYAICWGLPLVTTLIYIAFIPEGTYERPDGSSTSQLCSYGGHTEQQGFAWHMISYYGLLLFCIVYMIGNFLSIRSVYLLKEQVAVTDLQEQRATEYPNAANNTVLARVKMTSESLLLYPLIMVVFWIPHMIGVVLNLAINGDELEIYGLISTSFKILCGLAMSILFFWKSQAARTLWLRMLCCRYDLNSSAPSTSGRDSVASNGSCFRDSSFSECNFNAGVESFMGNSGIGSIIGSESVVSDSSSSVAMRVYSITVPHGSGGSGSGGVRTNSTHWKGSETVNPIGADVP